jgi:deoxycytidine triphosphate deaminase
MLLSDRDIRVEVEAGRLKVAPWEPELIQPSSVDVRLDRYFRVFNNSQYTHIDPAVQQDELTTLVEPKGEDPFVLHPGEFVLGSTLEIVTLPDDLAGRLEGKALALHTEVPTPSGWRTMAELQPGDAVFDEAGNPTEVVAATDPMHDRPCRRVVFSDHSEIVADARHLWRTVTKADRKQGRPGGQARTTDEIALSLRVGKEFNHHIPLAGAVQYPTAELPIDPYVLGYWLGDGTSTKAEITIGVQDEQFVLQELNRLGYATWPASSPRAFRVGGLGRGHVGRQRDRAGRYRADGSLASELRALGMLGQKHVPHIYMTAALDQRLALLQGLMDSDGYVDVFGRCEFVSTRESLADAVAELAASLGLRPVKRKKRVTLNGVECGPAYQVKFTPRLQVFRLPRKLARLKVDERGHAFRSIRRVEEVPSVPVRCIQVAAPSGMFLIGRRYIPTHNSSLGRLGLLTHSTAGFIDPGFTGHITLELSNVANLPITLWPGMKIGQLCLFRLSSPAEHPYGSAVYGSRYQGQRGPTPSRSYQNFRRWPTQ